LSFSDHGTHSPFPFDEEQRLISFDEGLSHPYFRGLIFTQKGKKSVTGSFCLSSRPPCGPFLRQQRFDCLFLFPQERVVVSKTSLSRFTTALALGFPVVVDRDRYVQRNIEASTYCLR
jgi:hypothetical protein